MGIKEDHLRRTFDLSVGAAEKIVPATKSDGSPYSPEFSLDITIQHALSNALMKMIEAHNKDLQRYYVAVSLPDGEQESYRFTIFMPDREKGNLLTQPPIYDAMERFLNRVVKEGDDEDILRFQTDYEDHSVTLHYRSEHLYETMHAMVHKIYCGNENILSHLYMARHLMDWQQDYRPKLQIN